MPTDPEYWISLARAQTEQFWRDLDAEFGLLTELQAAQALQTTTSDLHQLRLRGEVLAIERDGEVLFPGFQFDHGRPRPLLAKLTALRLKHGVTETDVIYWMCSPTTYFRDEKRAVDHLDEPDPVVAAAAAHWGVVW